jgi:protein required for attachment to host cells
MHDRAEAEFAKELASALEEMCRQGPARAIVIVAPPRTLAILRGALPASLHRQVVAEIDKDLTKFPVHEIERHLTAER